MHFGLYKHSYLRMDNLLPDSCVPLGFTGDFQKASHKMVQRTGGMWPVIIWGPVCDPPSQRRGY